MPLLGDLDKLLSVKPPKLIADAIDHIKDAAEGALNPIGHLIGLLQKLGAQERAKDEKKIAAEPKAPPQGPSPTNLLGPTTHTPKTKGPSVVAEWAEQLHDQEVLSKNFFGDQTETELAFWNDKLGRVKYKSREWLEIQSKIYDAEKTLARSSYDDHIAGLERQADADKEHWDKYRADLQAEADFVLKTYSGDTTAKEYQAQLRKIQDAEREHERVMRDIQRTGAQAKLNELKDTLSTDRAIRENNARQEESDIQDKAKYSANPLAEVHAEVQIATLHHQTAQQNIADMEQEYVASNKLLEADIANAEKGTEEYARAVAAKSQADVEFTNKHREMMNQMVNQEKADAEKIKQSWHSVIDPMVKVTSDQIKGLIEGTETWGQALRNIGEEALSAVIDAIEKMVEAWIVNLIVGKAVQSQTAVAQVVSYAGVAGAAGVASMAGAPFPIDLTAPAFGAAMSANALAYGSLASFDVGANYVPSDMVAQIHEGERIIPKADNAALMSALTSPDNSSHRGGDFHGNFGVHLHGVGSGDMDGRKVVKALESAQTHFSKLLKGMHRNGKFSYAGA